MGASVLNILGSRDFESYSTCETIPPESETGLPKGAPATITTSPGTCIGRHSTAGAACPSQRLERPSIAILCELAGKLGSRVPRQAPQVRNEHTALTRS